MAAPLSLTRTNVQTATGSHERVSITIRNNRAVLRRGRQVVEEADVVRVSQVERRRWEVELADGSIWSVDRKSGCGCGGG
jgi:hypothetical protein